ncbi:MAG TPA: DUF6174 domain-containing protein [Methylomirabilota bacterium]|nr:DUF6174 domain-containing protein [Methylomirabilota bacterium]
MLKHALLSLLLLITIHTSNAATPKGPLEILRHSLVQEVFAFGIRPQDTNWFDIEVSTNLTDWSRLATALSTNATAFFVDDSATNAPTRFYRLRIPGTTVAQQQAIWTELRRRTYTIQVERISSSGKYLSADVTVTSGAKHISNVKDPLTGEAVADFDPADFPSIEEIFTKLEAAAQTGIYDLRVWYDPKHGYPTRMIQREISGMNSNVTELRFNLVER